MAILFFGNKSVYDQTTKHLAALSIQDVHSIHHELKMLGEYEAAIRYIGDNKTKKRNLGTYKKDLRNEK
jgi:hypothetical protein